MSTAPHLRPSQPRWAGATRGAVCKAGAGCGAGAKQERLLGEGGDLWLKNRKPSELTGFSRLFWHQLPCYLGVCRGSNTRGNRAYAPHVFSPSMRQPMPCWQWLKGSRTTMVYGWNGWEHVWIWKCIRLQAGFQHALHATFQHWVSSHLISQPFNVLGNAT